MEFAPGPYGATGPARETSRLTTKNHNHNNNNNNNNNNNKPRTLSRQPSGQGLVAPGQGLVAPGQGLGPGLGIEFPTRPPTTGATGGIKDNYTGGYGYGGTGGGYGTSSMGVGGSGIGSTGGGGGSGGGGDTVVHYLDEVGSIGEMYQQ